MQEIQSIGIDWIPHDVLFAMVNKADSLNKEHHSVMPQNNETVVAPSKSNPRDPDVVNLANGNNIPYLPHFQSVPFRLNIPQVSSLLAPVCPTNVDQTQFLQLVSLPFN